MANNTEFSRTRKPWMSRLVPWLTTQENLIPETTDDRASYSTSKTVTSVGCNINGDIESLVTRRISPEKRRGLLRSTLTCSRRVGQVNQAFPNCCWITRHAETIVSLS